MDEKEFSLTLDLEDNYRFSVDFHDENLPSIRMDEPRPLGEGMGPNAARLLAAAVGNCLSASALYCLRRAKADVRGVHTTVHTTLTRNEKGRLRIGGLRVKIEPRVPPEDQKKAARCLEIFEDFCVVTQSVRAGVDVKVELRPVEA